MTSGTWGMRRYITNPPPPPSSLLGNSPMHSVSSPLASNKKRSRTSDLLTIEPHNTPLHAPSSSISWRAAGLSDSDGDDQDPNCQLHNSYRPLAVPQTVGYSSSESDNPTPIVQDESISLPPPAKRIHLDEATSGRFANLQIDPNAQSSRVSTSGGNIDLFGHPTLPGSSALSSFNLLRSMPTAPPSSPAQQRAKTYPHNHTSSTAADVYQSQVTAPPTSPVTQRPTLSCNILAQPPLPPPLLPFPSHLPSLLDTEQDLQDSDMRIRKAPTWFEIEPNRIVVTSLDDSSSSEDETGNEADDDATPDDVVTHTHQHQHKEGDAEFIVNHELMDKLEAHQRAVLTGTSERDQGTASAPTGRSRRSARRSGGGSTPLSAGSLLSARRKSAQSSPASSGYTSPINAEDARGALVLWRDPEEVLRVTTAAVATDAAAAGIATSNASSASCRFGNSPPTLKPDVRIHQATHLWSTASTPIGSSLQSHDPFLNASTDQSFESMSEEMEID